MNARGDRYVSGVAYLYMLIIGSLYDACFSKNSHVANILLVFVFIPGAVLLAAHPRMSEKRIVMLTGGP